MGGFDWRVELEKEMGLVRDSDESLGDRGNGAIGASDCMVSCLGIWGYS